jgi:hypothetical protein
MKRILTLAFVAALLMPISLSAKGPTTRITIIDLSRGASIDITDPSVVSRFNVWDGPGTFSTTNGREIQGMGGFIVDWRSGALSVRPTGLRRYEVRFYVRHHNQPPEQLAYTVYYERDPATRNGFVYLPGQSDEHYRLNVFSIHRGQGFEGNWFRASPSWLDAVEPLLLAHAPAA